MTGRTGRPAIETAFRFLAGLIGLVFLLLGLGFITYPDVLATAFSVQPAYCQGLNGIRADFGGLFLGLSFFCILGAYTGRGRWLVVPVVFLILIASGRVISLAVDGFSAAGARMLVAETVMLIVLAASTAAFSFKARPAGNDLKLSEVINFKILAGLAVVVVIIAGLFFSQKKIGLALVNGIAAKTITADIIADLPDGLHVALCGSGSPLADPRRASACVAVIAGKNFYVVDIGPGSERKLELMKLNPGKVKAVLLTHFHSDHIGDLGELILKRWSGGARASQLEVFGPPGVETMVQGFNLAYALDSQYRIMHHGPDTVPPSGAGGLARPFAFPEGRNEMVIINEDGVKITAFEVDHAPVKPAVGYRFDYQGRSVVISGDTLPVRPLFEHSRGADLLIQEALQPAMVGMIRDIAQEAGRPNVAKITGDIINYHTSPEQAARIASEANVQHLLLTHILPPLPAADLKPAFLGEAGKIFKGPITVGEDGLLFSLPAGNKKILKKWLL